MRPARFLLICAALFLITGCWSRRELTDVSFVALMGIDWVAGEYVVTINVLSPRGPGGVEGGGQTEQGVWTVTARSPTLGEAVARVDLILARSLTLSHVRAIILGEGLARKGIGPVVDTLLRSIDIRPTTWIGLTPGRAEALLRARPRQEPAPSNGPAGYHDIARRRSSVTPARRLTEVANILQEEGIDLTLPIFRLGDALRPGEEGGPEPSPENSREIVFGGAGVFRDDKLVDLLDVHESRGHLWPTGQTVHGVVRADCPDMKGSMVFRLRRGEGRITAWLDKGKPRAEMRIKVIADLNEFACEQPLIRAAGSAWLEDRLAKRIHEEILGTVQTAKSKKADIFGIGQRLFRKDPAYFNTNLHRWGDLFQEMPVNVIVTAQVPRLGQLNLRYRWQEPGSSWP